jgi:hypothetical protein
MHGLNYYIPDFSLSRNVISDGAQILSIYSDSIIFITLQRELNMHLATSGLLLQRMNLNKCVYI